MFYPYEFLSLKQRQEVAEKFGPAPVSGCLFEVDRTTGRVGEMINANIAVGAYVPEERAGLMDEPGEPVLMMQINGLDASAALKHGTPEYNFLALTAQKFRQMDMAIVALQDALIKAQGLLKERGFPVAFPRANLLADMARMGVEPGVIGMHGFDADGRWNLDATLLCGGERSPLAGQEVSVELVDSRGNTCSISCRFDDDGEIAYSDPTYDMITSSHVFDEGRIVQVLIQSDRDSVTLNAEEWKALEDGGSKDRYITRLVERSLASKEQRQSSVLKA